MLLDANGKEFATKPKQFVLRFTAIAFSQAVPPAIDYASIPGGEALQVANAKHWEEVKDRLVERETAGTLQLPAPEGEPNIGDDEAVAFAIYELQKVLTEELPDGVVALLFYGLLMERDRNGNGKTEPQTNWRPVGPFSYFEEIGKQGQAIKRVSGGDPRIGTANGIMWSL